MATLTIEQLSREVRILQRRSCAICTSTSNTIRFVNGSKGIIHGTWDNPITGDIIIDDSHAINGSTAMVIWSGSSNPVITGGTLESMVGNITGAGIYSIYFHYVHGRYNVNIFNTEGSSPEQISNLTLIDLNI